MPSIAPRTVVVFLSVLLASSAVQAFVVPQSSARMPATHLAANPDNQDQSNMPRPFVWGQAAATAAAGWALATQIALASTLPQTFAPGRY